MDVSRFIADLLKKKDSFTVKDIIALTNLSQPYIHRIITGLIESGLIVKSGKGRSTVYSRPGNRMFKNIKKIKIRLRNKDLSESDILNDINNQSGVFKGIKENVKSIAEYAFTEMLNNAIEHSQSKNIVIDAENQNGVIRFDITDSGIGLFNNLIRKFHLNNVLEAVQELLKGKKTTMPEAHSGEGIFFTSKSGDTFIIQSSEKKLFVNNLINDVSLGNTRIKKGTKITFTVSSRSKKVLKDIFDEYTDEDFRFSKTKVHVKLYKYGSEFLSRSQARRILAGLEKFKTIIIDFKDIDEIGQAFSDEIFRIYKRAQPDKLIEFINANENIEFMIRRALVNDLWYKK